MDTIHLQSVAVSLAGKLSGVHSGYIHAHFVLYIGLERGCQVQTADKAYNILAVCACGAHFTWDTLELVEIHITELSSLSHYWVYVQDVVIVKDMEDG